MTDGGDQRLILIDLSKSILIINQFYSTTPVLLYSTSNYNYFKCPSPPSIVTTIVGRAVAPLRPRPLIPLRPPRRLRRPSADELLLQRGFFASVARLRCRPTRYLNSPLTVAVGGLAKWLDILLSYSSPQFAGKGEFFFSKNLRGRFL